MNWAIVNYFVEKFDNLSEMHKDNLRVHLMRGTLINCGSNRDPWRFMDESCTAGCPAMLAATALPPGWKAWEACWRGIYQITDLWYGESEALMSEFVDNLGRATPEEIREAIRISCTPACTHTSPAMARIGSD